MTTPEPLKERDTEAPAGNRGGFVSRLYVMTGAPGTGKTAILRRLAGLVRCVDEPAREILAEQRAARGDGVPQRNASRFVELLLSRAIEKHEEAMRAEGAILFDRGVPDCVAYAERLEADPAPSERAARIHRYHPVVLVARPWAEIYGTDEERTIDFDGTLAFQESIERAYERAGYTLLEIPRGTIEERASFVRNAILGDPRSRIGAVPPVSSRRT